MFGIHRPCESEGITSDLSGDHVIDMFGVHMACEKGDITFSICHVTTISKSHVALWVGSSHLMSPPCYVWGPEALWKTFILVPMSIPMPRFTNGQNKYIFAIVLEKQTFRNISGMKLSSKAAIKMHFSVSMFWTCGEII